jgi:hypothetical protein
VISPTAQRGYKPKGDNHETDDRILPLTRIVAVIVIALPLAGFPHSVLHPDLSGERFAWAIRPHMTAMYMGAGYLGGSWLFINAIFGKRWHRIQNGFLPITPLHGS